MGFSGKTIYYSYLFSNSTHPWIDTATYKNVFFTDKIKPTGTVDVGSDTDLYSLDITSNQLRFDFHDTGMFTRGAFNGVMFEDRDNLLEPIVGIKLKTNLRGLDASDIIYPDGNHLYINWQNTSFSSDTYVWVTVIFGRDPVTGDSGKNVLKGTVKNELITGGAGIDTLTGGGGSDVFVFRAGDTGGTKTTADTILDFSQKDGDEIDLSKWDANSTKAGMQHFKFLDTAAFTHHAGEVRYDRTASDTYLQGDTNGDGKADFFIHLDDPVKLVKHDILL